MNIYLRSVIAGFVATIALSVLMVAKAALGMLPGLDVIHMLGNMAHNMIGVGGPAVGWLMHFLIGSVLWGLLFAALIGVLPGQSVIRKALVFATGAWLLMMLIPMPMAGAGLFGLNLGPMAPVMTLILHLFWGTVLGVVFRALPTQPTQTA